MLFLKRRFLRVYPTFWASIVVVVCIPYLIELLSALKSGVVVLPSPGFSGLDVREWLEVASLVAVFGSESGVLSDQFTAVNAVYWSLAIEFQFYLVMAFALCFGKYFREILVLVTACALVMSGDSVDVDHGFFFDYWSMFAIGILLAYSFRYEMTLSDFCQRLTEPHRVGIGVTVAVCAVVACASYAVAVAPVGGLEVTAVTALVIWAMSSVEPRMAGVRQNGSRPIRAILGGFLVLGSMSYSVYLLHGKIYQVPEMFVRQLIPSGGPSYAMLLVVSTLCLCWIFFCIVERRFLSARRVVRS